jgi:ribonuclease HI
LPRHNAVVNDLDVDSRGDEKDELPVRELREVGSQEEDVRFEWVRGHAGHAENERCDRLAVATISDVGLPADSVYEAVSRR